MQYTRCSICTKASRRQGKLTFLQFSNNIKLRVTSRPEGCQCDEINKMVVSEEEEEEMLHDIGISLNNLVYNRCNCVDCLSKSASGEVNFDQEEEEEQSYCTECGEQDCYLNKNKTFSKTAIFSTDSTEKTQVDDQEGTTIQEDDGNWKYYSVVGNSIIGNKYNKEWETLSDLIEALEANVAKMKLLATSYYYSKKK